MKRYPLTDWYTLFALCMIVVLVTVIGTIAAIMFITGQV